MNKQPGQKCDTGLPEGARNYQIEVQMERLRAAVVENRSLAYDMEKKLNKILFPEDQDIKDYSGEGSAVPMVTELMEIASTVYESNDKLSSILGRIEVACLTED